MSRRRSSRPKPRPAAAAGPQALPVELASLLTSGALPACGVKVRLRFPRATRYMEGLVERYVMVDGSLHVMIARAERHDDGHVRAIRRLIAWSAVESCSWDVPATPRDVEHAIDVHPPAAIPAEDEVQELVELGDAVARYDCGECGFHIIDPSDAAAGFYEAVDEHEALHAERDAAEPLVVTP